MSMALNKYVALPSILMLFLNLFNKSIRLKHECQILYLSSFKLMKSSLVLGSYQYIIKHDFTT